MGGASNEGQIRSMNVRYYFGLTFFLILSQASIMLYLFYRQKDLSYIGLLVVMGAVTAVLSFYGYSKAIRPLEDILKVYSSIKEGSSTDLTRIAASDNEEIKAFAEGFE